MALGLGDLVLEHFHLPLVPATTPRAGALGAGVSAPGGPLLMLPLLSQKRTSAPEPRQPHVPDPTQRLPR